VSVLIGDGKGGFVGLPIFPVTLGTSSFSGINVGGDFNGDGIPDLALAIHDQEGSIDLLLGTGDGSFQETPEIIPNTGTVSAMAVGAFQSNHLLDLAVIAGDQVGLLLNAGNAQFGDLQTYQAGLGLGSIVVGDFNGDNKADVAVNNPGSDSVNVLFGDGHGNLGSALAFLAGPNPVALAVGNFNQDSNNDLAITNQSTGAHNPTGVSVLLATPHNSFASPVSYLAGANPQGIAVGHFDADSAADLIDTEGVTASGGNTTRVLFGTGRGAFLERHFAAGLEAQLVATGDFNRDGNPDVIVTSQAVAQPLIVMLGDGQGGLGRPTNIGTVSANQVAVADVNRDGNPDLVIVVDGGVGVLLGKGDGTFGDVLLALQLGGAVEPFLVADFNGDDKPDVAVATLPTSPEAPGGVTVALGDGTGQFHAYSFFQGAGEFMVSGDFNGDHLPDIAMLDVDFLGGTGTVSEWLGNGHGAFTAGLTALVDPSSTWIAAGDFNGDGKSELVVSDYANGSADVLQLNAQGVLAVTPYAAGPGAKYVVVADFNGDNNLDLALSDFPIGFLFPDQVNVLLGNGKGGFGGPLSFGTGHAPIGMAVADMNRDGKPDLLVVNSNAVTVAEFGAGSVSVLLNRAP
jgi:prepilin-type processing-associated H-X9-DG protein